MPRARGMAAYVRDGYGAFRQPKFECGCSEMLFFRVFGVRLNLYVYSLYRNPDLDDLIFDCLLASMAAVQASFLFVSDLNGHHQEWLGSTITNRHGVAAFDFATVSGCDQMVVGWLMAQAVQNLCVSRKVFLKHQVNWNTVCGAIWELSWRDIWLSDNPVEVLNEHLSLLVGSYVATKVIRVRDKDKPWFDDQCRHALASSRRLIFGEPVIALGLIGKSLSAIK